MPATYLKLLTWRNW